MLQREKGWTLDGYWNDIWKEEVDGRDRKMYVFFMTIKGILRSWKASYVNMITGRSQLQPPPQFRGGLLADAPGLGKTLSIMALIASDRAMDALRHPTLSPNTIIRDCGASLNTTLVIVPKTRE